MNGEWAMVNSNGQSQNMHFNIYHSISLLFDNEILDLAETIDQSGFEPLSARKGVGVRRYKLVNSFSILVGQY